MDKVNVNFKAQIALEGSYQLLNAIHYHVV